MDARAVYSNVLMHVPDATQLEVNKYLQLALDEINSQGKETITAIAVVEPTSKPYGTPAERTLAQSFNYYPDVKCLVVPSSVTYVAKVYVNDTLYSPISASEYLKGEANLAIYSGKAYYLSGTGEMYFITDLVDGDIVKILGKAGIGKLELLPDSYMAYLNYYVLCGLYASEYKDADQYAIYSRKLETVRNQTMQETRRLSWMKRNGRLY